MKNALLGNNITRISPSLDGQVNNQNSIMKQVLLDVPGVNSVKWIQSVTSSVTTNWGVSWSEEMIARDIIQNFRDANKDDISSVKIDIIKDSVYISAPTEFDLRALFYIGSNKKNDDSQIGEFGEGAKVAFVSLFKKGVDYPISISGNNACIISVGDPIGDDLDLRPLVYNFFEINSLSGSHFFLKTYNQELKDAFKFGLNNFWYEQNPLLGEKLDQHNDISFYRSNEKHGSIFYGGIYRAAIKDIPLVVNINKKYAVIEKKINQDRDRNTFDDRLTQSLYKIICRSGFYYATAVSNPVISLILKETKKSWSKGTGHPLLKEVAENFDFSRNETDRNFCEKLFGDKYYSQSSYRYFSSSHQNWWDMAPEIASNDRSLRNANKIELSAYFVRFGVKSSAQMISEEKDKLHEEAKNKTTKNLTRKELRGLEICLECVGKISPEFKSLFSDIFNGYYNTEGGYEYNVTYKSVTSEQLLGELKDSNTTYGHKTIYLNKKLFKNSFGKVFSTLLHEMLHVFGRDGDRQFTDALTIVMERIINNHNIIKDYELKWNSFQKKLGTG